MSIRNFKHLFAPKSIAVIGASDRPGSAGAIVWQNLRRAGFPGALWPVNRHHETLDGVPVVRAVADLPEAPSLAVVTTPPASVPELIAQLGAKGTRAAIVLTVGMDDAQTQAMLDAARVHTLRILGPGSLGLLSPHAKVDASLSPVAALPGDIAFISQSAALVSSLLDMAHAHGIGFSHFISLGGRADIDTGDLLDWLGTDGRTRAILIYVESVRAARKFMSAGRATARGKPVIIVKAGRSRQGRQAAISHTGALAGEDLVYDAAIARAGMLRVDTLQDLFIAAEMLKSFRTNTAPTLTVLTNSGGAGVMAADAASRLRVKLTDLDDETRARLDAALPAGWSRANPVDLGGAAAPETYLKAWEALAAGPAGRAVLFIHGPTAVVPSLEIAQALAPKMGGRTPRVLACWLGEETIREARDVFRQAGIGCYATPEEAIRAFAMLCRYRLNQEQLLQTPRLLPPPEGGARADQHLVTIDEARFLIDGVLAEGREMLDESEAQRVLQAWGIPVPQTRTVKASASEAVAAADAIGYPVVVKVLSRDVVHKSDVGGVALDLHDGAAVRKAATQLLRRVRAAAPDAHIDGLVVQAMVRRRHAREVIVGASVDPVFGPVVLFGQGGTAVEVIADRAMALPPLTDALASDLVRRTRFARVLGAYRDTPAVDEAALHGVLMAVSQMLADLPELAEIDINPLLVDEHGAIALDARVRVSAARPAGERNFAIRPYPEELVEQVAVKGRVVTLRPIRPEDEAQHLEFLRRVTPEDIRLRVFYSRSTIEHPELARLTQVDYDRELAIVAVAPGPDGTPETLGVMRTSIDPENQEGEFGILVRSDLKGAGIGSLLMRKTIGVLRGRGTRWLVADVLAENDNMLAFMRHMGFSVTRNYADDDGTVKVKLDLQAPVAR